jgi:hypothetical protein
LFVFLDATQGPSGHGTGHHVRRSKDGDAAVTSRRIGLHRQRGLQGEGDEGLPRGKTGNNRKKANLVVANDRDDEIVDVNMHRHCSLGPKKRTRANIGISLCQSIDIPVGDDGKAEKPLNA